VRGQRVRLGSRLAQQRAPRLGARRGEQQMQRAEVALAAFAGLPGGLDQQPARLVRHQLAELDPPDSTPAEVVGEDPSNGLDPPGLPEPGWGPERPPMCY
jgi:hypothetical protein